MNRIRKVFESVAFAGMKTAAKPKGRRRLRWLGPLADPIRRFVDGGAAPSDPFYLSNRTLGQRVRLAITIAVPCLAVGGGLGLILMGYFGQPAASRPNALAPEQIAAKMLPDLNKDPRSAANREVDIPEVHVQPGTITRVEGTARNNTDHVVQNAELVFELTDSAGSRVGAVSTRIARIDPRSTVPFSFPVEQRDAAFVLVREIR